MKKQYQSPSVMVYSMQAVTMNNDSIQTNTGFTNGGKGLSTDIARGRDAIFWNDDDDFDK